MYRKPTVITGVRVTIFCRVGSCVAVTVDKVERLVANEAQNLSVLLPTTARSRALDHE